MSLFNTRRTAATIGDDIGRMSESISDVLHAAARAPRIELAQRGVAASRAARAQAQERLSELIEAARAKGGSAIPSPELRQATRDVAEHDATVRGARLELERHTADIAPKVAADLRVHAAVGAAIVNELIDLLDQALLPLAEARRFLAVHRLHEVPALIGIAPALTEQVRTMRAALNGTAA